MRESQRRVIGITALVVLLVALSWLSIAKLRSASRLGWAGMTYLPIVGSKKAPKPMIGVSPGSVVLVYPGSPASRAGIDRGDEVVAINGIPASDVPRLTTLNAATRAGDVLTYTIRRNGTTRDVGVRLESPVRSPAILVSLTVNVFVALTFLIIGFFVFLRRPSDARVVVFYTMTLIAAASFVSTGFSQIDSSNTRGIAVQPTIGSFAGSLSIAVTAAFFAPLLLHLALIFPLERPVLKRRRRLVFQWIYGFPIALSIVIAGVVLIYAIVSRATPANEKIIARTIGLTVTALIVLSALTAIIRFAIRLRRKGLREAVLTSPFASMTLLFAGIGCVIAAAGWAASRSHSPAIAMTTAIFIIFATMALFTTYPIATVVSLYRSYRESGPEERRQVKWPLWGTIVAVGARIILLAAGIAMGMVVAFGVNTHLSPLTLAAPDVIAKALYTLIPLSFAFAILKYRLMNIDVIIRRTVLYTILTGVIFVLYAATVASLGTALVKLGGVKNQTMLIASTVVIALFTVPLRNRLQRLVDRNLFRERRDFPLALRNLGSAIGTSADVGAFLRSGAAEIQQALQNRFVLIALRREADFVAMAKVGVADEVIGMHVPAATVSFGPDAAPDAFRRFGTRLVVPIPGHREPRGLLALGSRLSDEDFSTDDGDFIGSAAAQIAVGIDNLRLRDEEADFEQARAMQQILLPKSIPQLQNFEVAGLSQPARSVGGDYFDVLKLGDDRLGLCIADVAGKGMPAALLMANLQAAVKGSASREAGAAAVCDRVKEIVTGNLAGGKFITFFYGVLDAPSRTLTYCNAGHNPPIVSRGGGRVDRLMTGGPAICRLFQDAVHEQETIELHSGDRLILFTDGVSEARRGEDEFGEERLIEFVNAHATHGARELEQKILSRLRDFTAGDFSDDVTMVIVAAHAASQPVS